MLTLNVAALDGPRDWLDRQHAVWERLFDAEVDPRVGGSAPFRARGSRSLGEDG